MTENPMRVVWSRGKRNLRRCSKTDKEMSKVGEMRSSNGFIFGTSPMVCSTPISASLHPVSDFLRPVDPAPDPRTISTLDFLRLPFNGKDADGILKGDAVIVVGGKTDDPLYVHKFILANKSPVFFKMFDNKMWEGQTGMVHVDDASLPVMRSVIKFCYDAEINFTEEVTGEEVLAVAHKYDMALLRKISEEHLITSMNKSNLARRLKLAKKFEVLSLETAAISFFRNNFNFVISDVLMELC